MSFGPHTYRRKPLTREGFCFAAYTLALRPYPGYPEGGELYRWLNDMGVRYSMCEYPSGRAFMMLDDGSGSEGVKVEIGDVLVRGSSGIEVIPADEFNEDWEFAPPPKPKRPEPMPEVVETLSSEATDKFVQDPTNRCPARPCSSVMWQYENPTGGDSWYFVCANGHALWVGK